MEAARVEWWARRWKWRAPPALLYDAARRKEVVVTQELNEAVSAAAALLQPITSTEECTNKGLVSYGEEDRSFTITVQ